MFFNSVVEAFFLENFSQKLVGHIVMQIHPWLSLRNIQSCRLDIGGRLLIQADEEGSSDSTSYLHWVSALFIVC